jgi:hypothetical protein
LREFSRNMTRCGSASVSSGAFGYGRGRGGRCLRGNVLTHVAPACACTLAAKAEGRETCGDLPSGKDEGQAGRRLREGHTNARSGLPFCSASHEPLVSAATGKCRVLAQPGTHALAPFLPSFLPSCPSAAATMPVQDLSVGGGLTGADGCVPGGCHLRVVAVYVLYDCRAAVQTDSHTCFLPPAGGPYLPPAMTHTHAARAVRPTN